MKWKTDGEVSVMIPPPKKFERSLPYWRLQICWSYEIEETGSVGLMYVWAENDAGGLLCFNSDADAGTVKRLLERFHHDDPDFQGIHIVEPKSVGYITRN